ncbi:MAG: dipeptidase [Candidatus Cryptobacteroides sp.]
MKKIGILIISCLMAAQTLWAWEEEQLACTSIIVGREASVDGSVITSHTCDGVYRTWLSIEEAKDHPKGSERLVYKNTMHTASREDTTGVKLAGSIPEARHTYAYLNTAYPCLNEKQLGIGETTWGGPDTLRNPDSLFMIEELERMALERCSTAREAVLLMGSLAEKYGYADSGECLTVADPKEVWFFEIIGCGKGKKGAVWVAKRLPDEHVGVSANVPRIGALENDPKNFLCSKNVKKVALEYGLWDGKSEFKFWKVYKAEYARGKNFRERDWFILSSLAPSLGLTQDMDELPFSVKPDKKVDVKDVFALLRANYEGTELDAIKDVKISDEEISPLANPWLTTTMRKTLNYLKPDVVPFQRTVSVAWCSYSTVIQLRSWLPDAVGGVCYLGLDNPGQSPRVPIFCGNSEVPAAYRRCGQQGYDPELALWQFRKANKLATLAWQKTKTDFMAMVAKQEQSMLEAVSALSPDADAQTLNALSANCHDEAVLLWGEMEARLWETFGRGF